jgi:hypothetical protein
MAYNNNDAIQQALSHGIVMFVYVWVCLFFAVFVYLFVLFVSLIFLE